MTEKGVPRFVKNIAIIIVVGMAAAVGVAYLISEERSARDRRDDCAVDVLTDLVEAANERTTYTENLSQANEDQLRAFNALVLASLEKPPPTEKEAREIVVDYRDALAEYFEIADKARQSRRDAPYPTEQEIARCQ